MTRHILLPLLLTALAIPARAAINYTWSGGGNTNASGTWTTTTDWSPTGTPGTAATDAVTLGNVTAGTRTISFNDTAAIPVSIASLAMPQTSAFINQLDLSGGDLYVSSGSGVTLAASTGGTTEISVESGYYFEASSSAGLTLNSGGLLVLSGTSQLGKNTGSSSLTSLIIAGGELNAGFGGTGSSSNSSVDGNVTMTDNGNAGTGELLISNSTGSRQFIVSGNVDIEGGTVAVTNSTAPIVKLSGASNIFEPDTYTYSNGKTVTTAGGWYINFTGSAQSLTTNQPLPAGLVLNAGVKTVTFVGSSNVGSLSLVDGNTTVTGGVGAGSTLQLGSNITLLSGATLTASSGSAFDANNAVQMGIDINGNTLDLTNVGTYTPNAASSTSGFTTQYTFLNSGTAGTGSITAGAFVLSASNTSTTIGPGVTIIATGSASGTLANDLGSATAGATIDPTSTFVYAGTATSASPATLTSNRAIGGLAVSSGVLQLATTGLTVAGDVAVSTGASLQLGGQMLTLTSGANLKGYGTVAALSGTTPTASTVAFASGATGGILPGDVGSVGTLTLSGPLSLTLTSTSTSQFDIEGTSTFGNDHLTLSGTTLPAIKYAGALALNFLGGFTPTVGQTFQIVDADSTATGNFSAITSNVSGDAFTFNPLTGVLTVTPVPEASTTMQATLGLVVILGTIAYRRRRLGGTC